MATLNFEGYNVPEHTQGALERYINHGLAPGSFLTAVLTNDLMGSCSCADAENMRALTDIVKWLYNRAPMGCHGSTEKVSNWMRDMSMGE